MIIGSVMIIYELSFAACVLILGFGGFLIALATSQCIEESLFFIGQNSKVETNLKCISEQFIEFISLHSHMKELSKILYYNTLSLNNE